MSYFVDPNVSLEDQLKEERNPLKNGNPALGDTNIDTIRAAVRTANQQGVDDGILSPKAFDPTEFRGASMRGVQASKRRFGPNEARRNFVQKEQEYDRRFGFIDDNIMQAESAGINQPENIQEFNSFRYKITSADAKGKFIVQDQRSIGWADASVASFFMSQGDLDRAITSRNAAKMQIDKNLMRGGLRAKLEEEGLETYTNPYDADVDDMRIAGDGYNMNPLNYRETFDLFGLIDSPDTNALMYEDPDFKAEAYMARVAELRPGYLEMLQRTGMDLETLKKTKNANQFWYSVNKALGMMGAYKIVSDYRENSNWAKRWLHITKDFFRDSVVQDPDFAGELVMSGILFAASGATATPFLLATHGARMTEKGLGMARHLRIINKHVSKGMRRLHEALPQNWGTSVGYGIRNTAVGRFLNVTADDVVLDGVKIGMTKKHGAGFLRYTAAELPAGFVEEGIAGVMNAISLNRYDESRERELFSTFIREGLHGAVARAYILNPSMRAFSSFLRFGGGKAGMALNNYLGDLGQPGSTDSVSFTQQMGGFFTKVQEFGGLADVGWLDGELDMLEFMAWANSKQQLTDTEVAQIEGLEMGENATISHPALVMLSEMSRFDTSGSLIGRSEKTGNLKIIDLFEAAHEMVARQEAGIEAKENLVENESDSDEVKAQKKEMRAVLAKQMEKPVSRDAVMLAALQMQYGKLDNNAKDALQAQTRRNEATFMLQVKELSIQAMEKDPNLTPGDAMTQVLRDPELLQKLDNSGLTRELNQLIYETHPDLFSERKDENGNTYYEPISTKEQEVKELRAALGFEAEILAIKRHREKLGIAKDARFIIKDLIAQKNRNIFRELNTKLNHIEAFPLGVEFINRIKTDQTTRFTTKVSGNLADADVIIMEVSIRGSTETQTLVMRRTPLITQNTEGSWESSFQDEDGNTISEEANVVNVTVNATTIEGYEGFTGFLNTLPVIQEVDVDRLLADTPLARTIGGKIRTQLLAFMSDKSDAEVSKLYLQISGIRSSDAFGGSTVTLSSRQGVGRETAALDKRRQEEEHIISVVTEYYIAEAVQADLDAKGISDNNAAERLYEKFGWSAETIQTVANARGAGQGVSQTLQFTIASTDTTEATEETIQEPVEGATGEQLVFSDWLDTDGVEAAQTAGNAAATATATVATNTTSTAGTQVETVVTSSEDGTIVAEEDRTEDTDKVASLNKRRNDAVANAQDQVNQGLTESSKKQLDKLQEEADALDKELAEIANEESKLRQELKEAEAEADEETDVSENLLTDEELNEFFKRCP